MKLVALLHTTQQMVKKVSLSLNCQLTIVVDSQNTVFANFDEVGQYGWLAPTVVENQINGFLPVFGFRQRHQITENRQAFIPGVVCSFGLIGKRSELVTTIQRNTF